MPNLYCQVLSKEVKMYAHVSKMITAAVRSTFHYHEPQNVKVVLYMINRHPHRENVENI